MATNIAWTKYAFWILHRSTHALKKACLSVCFFSCMMWREAVRVDQLFACLSKHTQQNLQTKLS